MISSNFDHEGVYVIAPFEEYQPIKRIKTPLKAFCTNCRVGTKYKVEGEYRVAFVRKADFSDTDCPMCKHALLWSREYRLAPDKKIHNG